MGAVLQFDSRRRLQDELEVNIMLRGRMKNLVNKFIEDGLYSSHEEVIFDALRTFTSRAQKDTLELAISWAENL